MFATKQFPDVFSFLNDGLTLTSLSGTGTNSGSAMQVGGSAAVPWRKIGFILQAASGSASTGTMTFYIQTATASNGTYATFTTSNQSNSSIVMSCTGTGKWYIYAEARGEMFTDLGTNGYWIKPVVIQSAAMGPAALCSLGFVEGSEPASNYNDAAVNIQTFMMM